MHTPRANGWWGNGAWGTVAAVAVRGPARRAAVACALAALACSPLARAAGACYAFTGLSGEYHVGDTIAAPLAEIRLEPFLLDGQAHRLGVARTGARDAAAGTGSVLEPFVIDAVVVPHVPSREVAVRFEERLTPDSPHGNLAANGDVREVIGSLALLDGATLGPAGGRVAVAVTIDPMRRAGTRSGTLALRALDGGIETLAIGGIELFIDELCVTP